MLCQFSLIHSLRFNASRGLLQAFKTHEAISVREGGKFREGKSWKNRGVFKRGTPLPTDTPNKRGPGGREGGDGLD